MVPKIAPYNDHTILIRDIKLCNLHIKVKIKGLGYFLFCNHAILNGLTDIVNICTIYNEHRKKNKK